MRSKRRNEHPFAFIRHLRLALLLSLFVFVLTAGSIAVWAAADDRGSEAGEAPNTTAETALKDPQVVREARKNKIAGGKVVKTSKGYVCEVKGKVKKISRKWVMINGSVYYFNRNGYALAGKYLNWKGFYYKTADDGKLYVNKAEKTGSKMLRYFGATGAMVRDKWQRVGGSYYYFLSNGTAAVNRWVGMFYVDHNGRLVRGLKRIKNTPQERRETGRVYRESDEEKLIILGASRVVMMKRAVGAADTIYIAKSGAGFSWFYGSAVSQLRAWLNVYPKSTVVLQFGNNDLASDKNGRFSRYKRVYAALIRLYPKAKFCVMDILPADNTKHAATNKLRIRFNIKLAQAFPEQYIGGYSYMVRMKFRTLKDGVHYTDATSRMIYRYILSKTK